MDKQRQMTTMATAQPLLNQGQLKTKIGLHVPLDMSYQCVSLELSWMAAQSVPVQRFFWYGMQSLWVGHKTYLHQLITDFQNSFTDALCGKFATVWLLYLPPHRKCISTLPCEI